jgi:hypothetical protein
MLTFIVWNLLNPTFVFKGLPTFNVAVGRCGDPAAWMADEKRWTIIVQPEP